MLNGASDRGQRIFLIKCVIYCKFKEGDVNPTIRTIFHESGMSHFKPQECGALFLDVIQDPMIEIKSKTEPFTTGNVFNLDLDILISINPSYEKRFIDFVNKRMEVVIDSLRMSPVELRKMQTIQAESNMVTKLRNLIMLLRYDPIPHFTY
ncbi:MAG TPA: hypothetical protein VGR54_02885 [Nitrosopumilaceae archaeon]|nr:hypothetical protein [Nitrosopumilaceae archaeon]